jgi:hypothetical protein
MVGFQKIAMERGKLYLVNSAFEDIDGNPLDANDVIGNQLPNESKIFWFDASVPPSGQYKVDQINLFGTWSSNITFRGDMGFFIQVSPGAGGPYDVVVKGQVPEGDTTPTTVLAGLNQLGFPYTASVVFSNTALYATAPQGSKLHIWNVAGQTWDPPFQKNIFNQWPPGDSFVIDMGTGYFLETASGFVNTESRPYNP